MILMIWDKIESARQYFIDEVMTIIACNSGQSGAFVDLWLLSMSRRGVGSVVGKAVIKSIIKPGCLAVTPMVSDSSFNERNVGNIGR
jgi:hypothetical protein